MYGVPLYFSIPLLSAALLEGAVLIEGAGLIEDLRYIIYKASLHKLSKTISHLNLYRDSISRTSMGKEFQSLLIRLEKS